MKYAKAYAAIIGSTITAALAIFPSGTTTWDALTIAMAAVTAVGVYLVPNDPTGT